MGGVVVIALAVGVAVYIIKKHQLDQKGNARKPDRKEAYRWIFPRVFGGSPGGNTRSDLVFPEPDHTAQPAEVSGSQA